MPPKQQPPTVVVRQTRTASQVGYDDTPVEMEEPIDTVVRTVVRKGRRPSKKQRFEKTPGGELVEKPAEASADPISAESQIIPDHDLDDADVAAYLGYPDQGDSAAEGADDERDEEDVLPSFGPQLSLSEEPDDTRNTNIMDLADWGYGDKQPNVSIIF